MNASIGTRCFRLVAVLTAVFSSSCGPIAETPPGNGGAGSAQTIAGGQPNGGLSGAGPAGTTNGGNGNGGAAGSSGAGTGGSIATGGAAGVVATGGNAGIGAAAMGGAGFGGGGSGLGGDGSGSGGQAMGGAGASAGAGAGAGNGSAGAAGTAAGDCNLSNPVSFRRDVEPFLTNSCGKANGSGCHVTDNMSTMSSGGFDHAYDWITAGSHASSCPEVPNPKRFEVVLAVIGAANPPTCSRSRKMPPAGMGTPPTACELAALTAWLALPKVTQTHRADDSSPTTPYPMPPYN